jgi:hypothetical protein
VLEVDLMSVAKAVEISERGFFHDIAPVLAAGPSDFEILLTENGVSMRAT